MDTAVRNLYLAPNSRLIVSERWATARALASANMHLSPGARLVVVPDALYQTFLNELRETVVPTPNAVPGDPMGDST